MSTPKRIVNALAMPVVTLVVLQTLCLLNGQSVISNMKSFDNFIVYNFIFNKESVVVEAHSYYDDVDDWCDYIDVKRIWQHRTFVFKPIDGDESSLDSILDVFWKWIGDRFFDWSLDKILNEQAERLVSNFMKENFEIE